MSLRTLLTLAATALLAVATPVSDAALGLVTSDIRPAAFVGHALDADRLARGRAIAARGVEVQGGAEAWESQRALSLRADDAWDLSPFRMTMPLAEDRVVLDGEIALHHALGTSTWTVASGRAAGERFGVSDGDAWYGGEEQEGGWGVGFFAPTMEYLPTLAFHVPTADVVSWIDAVERDGVLYDRVFVTWGDPEQPNAEVDQYLAYYERSTGRLVMLECTVRAFGPFIDGAIRYEAWTSGDALSIPSAYSMHLVDLDGPRAHRVLLSAVEWR